MAQRRIEIHLRYSDVDVGYHPGIFLVYAINEVLGQPAKRVVVLCIDEEAVRSRRIVKLKCQPKIAPNF